MGGINMKDINWEQSYNPWHVYSQSKLANVYYTKILAMKLEKEKIQNVKVVSLHPGLVRTELGRYMATNICALFIQQVLCCPVSSRSKINIPSLVLEPNHQILPVVLTIMGSFISRC